MRVFSPPVTNKYKINTHNLGKKSSDGIFGIEIWLLSWISYLTWRCSCFEIRMLKVMIGVNKKK